MIPSFLYRTGPYIVKFPTRPREVLTLGAHYLAHEATLADTDRLKDFSLALIQSYYDIALAAFQASGTGEATRAAAAETLRQKYLIVHPMLEMAIYGLKIKCHANLAQLEGWGIRTTVGKNGVTVYKPRTQNEWLAFLNAYVTKETSLPVAERLTAPDLATLQTLHAEIQTALTTRISGRNTRETGVENLATAIYHLRGMLIGACISHVLFKYDGVVTNGLQKWGFTVVARTPTPEIPPATE